MNNVKDLKPYITSRRPLWHTAEAIRRGHITIAFVGGSITEPGDAKRWADKVADWFVARYPGLIVDVENAAKGATGSLSSILYVDDSVIPYKPDLIFVESAVNDGEQAWGACREGVVRKLLEGTESDIVVTYTYSQAMYDDFLAGTLPRTIRDWEELADHYSLTSVFMSRYTFDLVMSGFLKWEEWLPDGLHPADVGSRFYAEPVCALLEEEIANAKPQTYEIPAPLHADNWGKTYRFPLEKIERHGAWRLVHERRIPTVEYILFTASMTSSLFLKFEGRGFVLRKMENLFHAAYQYRIDGGEWVKKNAPLPAWSLNATDWVREMEPVTGLEDGEHTLEIQPIFAPDGRGSTFELTDIAIIR